MSVDAGSVSDMSGSYAETSGSVRTGRPSIVGSSIGTNSRSPSIGGNRRGSVGFKDDAKVSSPSKENAAGSPNADSKRGRGRSPSMAAGVNRRASTSRERRRSSVALKDAKQQTNLLENPKKLKFVARLAEEYSTKVELDKMNSKLNRLAAFKK
jgi:hypothetical protein